MKKENGFYLFLRAALAPLAHFIFRAEAIHGERIPLEGRCIVAGNHRSYFDVFFLAPSTKRVLNSLLWYSYYDIAPWFFKRTGTISVKPDGKEAFHQAVDLLNQEKAIHIHPEGAINRTDDILLPFKNGTVIMSQRTNSPIVLFAITGDIKLFSKNLKIGFSEPFYVTDMPVDEATEYIRNKLLDMIKEQEKN